MLQPNFGSESKPTAFAELASGAATIVGLANLCATALAVEPDESVLDRLSDEAKAILVVAANRGTMDIRTDRDAFDSTARFLAVCVEFELDQHLLFLQKSQPEQTLRFLDGFRQLCANGLIVHHLQKDFSLSATGFELARKLDRADYAGLIEFGVGLAH